MLRLRIEDVTEQRVTCLQVVIVGVSIVAPLLAVVIGIGVPPLRERMGWVVGGLFAAAIVGAVVAGLLTPHSFELRVSGPLVQVSRGPRAVFECHLDRPFGLRVDVPSGDAEAVAPFRVVLEQAGARFSFTAQGDVALLRDLSCAVEIDPQEEPLGVAEPSLADGDVMAVIDRVMAADGLSYIPLWPWEEILSRLWSEHQPDALLGRRAFGRVRLLVGGEDEFFVVTDQEIATPWFSLPREGTSARLVGYPTGRGWGHRIDLFHRGQRFEVSADQWMGWDQARAVVHFINGERPPQLCDGGTRGDADGDVFRASL